MKKTSTDEINFQNMEVFLVVAAGAAVFDKVRDTFHAPR